MSAVLCLVAAGTVAALPLSADGFELRWTHSVEKVEWREHWVPDLASRPAALRLAESRVKGSGAGMEPPSGSVLADGWYVHRPPAADAPRRARLALSRSKFAAPYTLCLGADCQPLETRLAAPLPPPAQAPVITLSVAAQAADCPPSS